MTHASLFSGIGGFDLGFELAGHETVFQCEVDKACREALEHHWPGVERHDDIRTLDGSRLRGVGIITGGFPCQDLSVAGKREGLSGSRSGLFFELVRVVDEARPDYLCWENVPGLCSSSGGRDFRTVLGTLADLSYFGAVRLLDSQFFGVPQRRRRLFGVFARGDSGWRRAGAVLFDEPGGVWNPAKGRKAGKDIAHSLDSGTGGVSGKEQQRTIAFSVRPGNRRVQSGHNASFVAQPLRTNPYNNSDAGMEGGRGRCGLQVRRLVPTECESLQGFPRGWTNLSPEDGPLPRGMDSRRYRQLGNAVTVNVAYWLGKRIANVERHHEAAQEVLEGTC